MMFIKNSKLLVELNMNNMLIEKIELACIVMKSPEDRVIVIAPHLNIVGFGKTQQEAEADFDSAINKFFKYHHKNNTLEAKLDSLGFKKSDHTSTAPKEFNVPTHLLKNFGSITNSQVKNYPAPVYN